MRASTCDAPHSDLPRPCSVSDTSLRRAPMRFCAQADRRMRDAHQRWMFLTDGRPNT